MWRKPAVSVAFGIGLMAVAALGQPPAATEKAQPKKAAAPDTIEAQIAAALANDSDVRVAKAKIMLAEAELGKARQAVTQRVVTLAAQIAELKRTVEYAEQNYRLMEELFKKGAVPQSELLPVREKLETAKARLATAETELKLLTGNGPKAPKAGLDLPPDQNPAANEDLNRLLYARHVYAAQMQWLAQTERAAGPIPTRLRAALDKTVKLGAKGDKVTFETALDVFKTQAGLDVPVRGDFKVGPITSLGEELPIGAWLQLFADGTPDIHILVREYGLLVTSKAFAPPDAISVVEFWKQPAVHKPEDAPKK